MASEVAEKNERAKSKYDEAKTFAMNKYLFSEGNELVVENSGRKYVEIIDSIKYLKNGDIEVVAKRKRDGEARNVYVLNNGKSEAGARIDGLVGIDKVVENYVELDKDFRGLGSENGFKYENDRKDFEKQNDDLIKNPEKIKEFVEELYAHDPVKVSAEHKKNLSKVIDMFVGAGKNFIPEMNVYLNKKAESNGGYIELDGPEKGIYVGASNKHRPERNAMSAAEAYVHEIIHAATEYAKQNRGGDVARNILRLQKVREDVLKELKVEDFLVKPYSISSFKEMITKLIEKIDKKAVKVKEEKELQENLCQIKALVEKDFISEMIQNKKIEEKELANYLKVLELESSKFNCIISKIKEENLQNLIV